MLISDFTIAVSMAISTVIFVQYDDIIVVGTCTSEVALKYFL